MTRISKLTGDTEQFEQFDLLKSKEAQHECLKVTITLSPLAQYVVEQGIQPRLSISRSAAVSALLEAAVEDWLDSKSYVTDSPEFLKKYMSWLSPAVTTAERAADMGLLSNFYRDIGYEHDDEFEYYEGDVKL